MAEQHNLDMLAHKIREIYEKDELQAENCIEAFLKNSLEGESGDEKIKVLDELKSTFEPIDICTAEDVKVDQEILIRIFSFLLGKRVSQADLSSANHTGKPIGS